MQTKTKHKTKDSAKGIMKTARYGNLIIIDWNNSTVTIYNENKKTTRKYMIYQKNPYGAYGITYINVDGKRILLDEFEASCGGNFLHHWRYD